MILIPARMILLHPIENQKFDFVVNVENITKDSVVAILLDEFNRFDETGYYLNYDEQNHYFIESAKIKSSVNSEKIIARPHEIGVIRKKGDIRQSFEDSTFVDLFSDENIDLVKSIYSKDEGFCMIICEDEYTNPKAYENVGLWDGKPKPVLINQKICLELR